MKTKFIFLLFILFTSIPDKISAQDSAVTNSSVSATIYKIELIDGTEFVGNILHQDSTSITIRTTSLPKIEIPISQIKHLDELEKENFVKGRYWFKNPNATRYLFSPSAYNLEEGEGYYQNTYLVVNSFNVGVTDYFSLGGGLELISTVSWLTRSNSSEVNPIIFITPKFGFKIAEKWHAGAGMLLSTNPDDTDSDGLGVGYGVVTYGTLDHNITTVVGWGFFGIETTTKPIITISGITRIAKRTALVTENWFIPDDPYYNIYSYGIRFFGEKIAVDLAFLNNSEIVEEFFIGIPYVDFVVKF